MKASLDKTDIEILKILSENARTSIKSISEKTFVSPPTVAARIEAMEREGIIQGYHARISPLVLGSPIRTIISLQSSPNVKEELYRFIKQSPAVIECDHVTGEYSVIIKAIFQGTPELEKFVTQLQKFGRTKTQIIFSSVVDKPGFSLDNLKQNFVDKS